MIVLRVSGPRLLAFDSGLGLWYELPAVYQGWRAARRIKESSKGSARTLGPLADRTLRRIVGLPGEPAPEPKDWQRYSAPLLAAQAREREAVLVG